MYPLADGSELTSEQRRRLDDELFASSPSAYWRARIDVLLADPPDAAVAPARLVDIVSAGLSSEILTFATPTDEERELQRRLDAFALRHHVAEALIRLVHAVTVSLEEPGRCVWADLTAGPARGKDAVDAVRARAYSETNPIHLNRLFLAAGDQPVVGHLTEELLEALRVAWSWVERAAELLISDGLDINAGHNKLKHGLAVRARDDERIEVTTVAPDGNGNMPLSAFQSSVPVVDDLSAAFLTVQAGKKNPFAGSWEMTVLNLRTGPILAEALMLNMIYGAVFAVAAERHFNRRELTGPEHPGLPLGPTPDRFARSVDGIRHPLTKPASGGDPRPAIIQRGADVFQLKFTGPPMCARVVDDASVPSEAQPVQG